MSVRHTPRQPERERDIRLHEIHPNPHALGPPSHGPSHHPLHLNGAGPIPSTPGSLSGGPPHPAHQMVSPNGAPAAANAAPAVPPSIQKLASANEQTWLLIGRVAEQMGDLEHALSAYENALRHNPMSLPGLTQVAGIARIKENYPKAVEFFQRALSIQQENGEVWSALGHCYLMQDDLQKAYAAYQQALYLLPNPKEDPKLWYGIGILYDRYGSLDHAEEAFSSVLRMDKDFDKANEILFRLGIIYKQQAKYRDSLACFDKILRNPPNPLAHADIWFQIGHVYEQEKDFSNAKDAYERVVAENPNHAKVLQQLGWLYHQDGSVFQNQELAIQYLTKSLEADPADAQSWYLLGRAYMAGQKYNKAYEAYQQAVYRDGRNPTFWCSIGVLYFQINQYRDALDAYSRAIRINPYISEVWFDLGSLYESCNNQISDAIDAYARAAELDPNNTVIRQRLDLLKNAKATGIPLPAAPGPQDVHPTAYASAVVPPPGPPMLLQTGGPGPRPLFRADSRGPADSGPFLPLPQAPNVGRSGLGPFRSPPPVILDDSRTGPNTLAPMEVDRPPMGRHSTAGSISGRDGPSRGPGGHGSILLHHPVPQQQFHPEDVRPAHPNDSYRDARRGPPSTSASPPPRARSPGSISLSSYPQRPPVTGPGQPSEARPSGYSYDPYAERDHPFDRRRVANEREDEREKPRNPYPPFPYQDGPGGPRPHSPARSHRGRGHSPQSFRERSSSVTSPRTHPNHPPYWDAKQGSAAPSHPGTYGRPSPAGGPGMQNEPAGRRYDPRFDARPREYERDVDMRQDPRYAASPDARRGGLPPPPHLMGHDSRGSESPHVGPAAMAESKSRRRNPKEKEPEPEASNKRKRRGIPKKVKEEPSRAGSPKPQYAADLGPNSQHQQAHFKVGLVGHMKNGTPEPGSSNGSRSNGSMQPSPTSATPVPPARVVDEDYDEGVADTLLGLAAYRGAENSHIGPGSAPSRPPQSHRNSISSTVGHTSPAHHGTTLKRAMSPMSRGGDESDNKRARMEASSNSRMHKRPMSRGGDENDKRDAPRRRVSSGSVPPPSSTRPSPIPFRTQPSHGSPESPPLQVVLPPHPRPIGTGMGSAHAQVTLPSIATLSPKSSEPGDDERMLVDRRQRSDSGSPPVSAQGRKLVDVMRRESPPQKSMPSPPAIVSLGNGAEKQEPA